jgi:hypothetical protein
MNLEIDIHSINIPELIKSGKYYQKISTIKNHEDTLQKLLSNEIKSHFTNNPNAFIWKIDNDLLPDLCNDVVNLGKELFGETFENIDSNIVITGPFVRSCLIGGDKKTKNEHVKIMKELYMFKYSDKEWDNLLDLDMFENKENEYVYENNNKKIFLIKKKYKNPAHIILQHDYLKRVGYCNGVFYCSSMFLIEIQKHLHLINSNFCDPVLNIPYDPLKIYQICNKNKNSIINIIEAIDLNKLLKISNKSLSKIYGEKTCIELCLDKLVNENNPVFLDQLKQMIGFLGKIEFKRPPHLYAKILKIDELYPEIFSYLKSINTNYLFYNINFKTLNEINNHIIYEIIKNDDEKIFIDYINYCNYKIKKTTINIIIKFKSKKIIKLLINNKILDNPMIYYLILMTEDFDLLNLINFEFDIDIGLNYLIDILQNGKTRSFYFLYDKDPTILNILFDNNKNLLHMVNYNNNCSDLIELIIKLKPELLNLKDQNEESPVLYHAKYNHDIIKIFLQYDFDYTIIDGLGNTFIHNLCLNNCPEVLKMSLKRCLELINMPNKKSESPVIICVKNNHENMFYILNGMGCDLNLQDCYGNTVYHYICENKMCLKMMIYNRPNYFGFTPFDYCKVAKEFYNFIN